MNARYRAVSVTGYSITPNTGSGPPETIWYVQDTGDQYRIVKSFKGYRNGHRSALELARILNDDDLNPVPPHPGPTHCKRGHRYDLVNTRVDKRGARSCRECMRLNQQAWRKARR